MLVNKTLFKEIIYLQHIKNHFYTPVNIEISCFFIYDFTVLSHISFL